MDQNKNKIVVIFGTYHSFQKGIEKRTEFEQAITDIIEKHNVSLIGDEIDGSHSVVKDVASKQNIGYIIIEPTPSEKEDLGIEQEHCIRYELESRFQLEGEPDVGKWHQDAKNEYFDRLEKTYREREAEWLNRIENSGVWPALAVFGSYHYEEFGKLLTQKGYQVIKESPRWGEEYKTKL